jgi:predicted N-acetyltransferase YhbS
MSDPILRTPKPEDARRIGEIIYEAFRTISESHNFPPDFPSVEPAVGLAQMMIARADVYGVAAEIGGEIVGSNFLWESDDVAGVGPITVDPMVQNSSIGKMLMQDVIRRAEEQGKSSTRLLQAAYHNRSLALYTKLGFNTVEPLSAFSGPAFQAKLPGRETRTLTQSDIDEANEVCQAVHGISRRNEIAGSAQIGSGLVVTYNGRITGYTTGIGMFGHAACETADDLKALIGSGREISGPVFMLPTRNSEMMRWCFENGLRVVQPMTLMSKGVYQEPRGAFLPSILY